MRVPIVYGDQRMGGMPGGGPSRLLSGDDFGARAYRDLYDMAGALGGLGLAYLQTSQERILKKQAYERDQLEGYKNLKGGWHG